MEVPAPHTVLALAATVPQDGEGGHVKHQVNQRIKVRIHILTLMSAKKAPSTDTFIV